MHWGNYQLFFSYIFAFTLHFIDGCGRTPARPKPTPTTARPDRATTPSTTYGPNEYQLPCTPEEVKEANCRNGGECFALEILESRGAHCRCPEMWTGKQCELIDGSFFPVLPAQQFKVAGIATGVAGLVIILTIVLIVIIIQRRKARRRQRDANQNNGYVCKSLMQDGNNVDYPPYNYSVVEKSETNV